VALGSWRRGRPRPLAGGRVFVLLFRLFFRCFFRDGEAAATSWNQNKVLPALYILAPVLRLALAEGAWSHVYDGILEIRSVFMFLGVVSGQNLPFYGYHHWRWLLLWCIGPLWP
jgi:hypothetical protein